MKQKSHARLLIVYVLLACSTATSQTSDTQPVLSLEVVGTNMSMNEHERDFRELKIVTDADLETYTDIFLDVSGTARVGVDYDLQQHITLSNRHTEWYFSLAPIRDWIKEGTETIVVQLIALGNTVRTSDSAVVQLEILDDFPEDSPDPDGDTIETTRSPDLDAYAYVRPTISTIRIAGVARNFGSQESPAVTVTMTVAEDASFSNVLHRTERDFPGLDALGGWYGEWFSYDPSTFDPYSAYYVRFSIPPVTGESFLWNNNEYFSFKTGSLNNSEYLLARCINDRPSETTFNDDPYLEEQWHLKNTGQATWSSIGGFAGADLRMADVLSNETSSAPSGTGIGVAVIDTGMEICHPDLADNVSEESINFASQRYDRESFLRGSVGNDPFNPDTDGDHGTAVAGVIGSVSDNGIGGRGIAPNVQLIGMNYLKRQSRQNLYTSLGASSSPFQLSPIRNLVDVFNMSYGSSFSNDWDQDIYEVFLNGVTTLRDGLGAIYVKSAGNGFSRCSAIYHRIHEEIGCLSSNADFVNILPYIISVGGFNAHDRRSSYASSGANLWVAAPAGQWGRFVPAIVTTDQMGRDAGYDQVARRGLALRDDINPHGDYISTFNGTSAASAMVSGVIALLLEKENDLSWRDVRHVLASTARQIHRGVGLVRVAIGESPYVMQNRWRKNGAGFWFHNWYGFGAANVDAALEMLETYEPGSLGVMYRTPTYTHYGYTSASTSTGTIQIPDADGSGVTLQIPVSIDPETLTRIHPSDEDTTTPSTDPATYNVESLIVTLELDHENLSDIGITLISPSGMESIINPVFNNNLPAATSGFEQIQLSSNAFYQENPNGTWLIKFVDVQTNHIGTVNLAGIRFYIGQTSEQDM